MRVVISLIKPNCSFTPGAFIELLPPDKYKITFPGDWFVEEQLHYLIEAIEQGGRYDYGMASALLPAVMSLLLELDWVTFHEDAHDRKSWVLTAAGNAKLPILDPLAFD